MGDGPGGPSRAFREPQLFVSLSQGVGRWTFQVLIMSLHLESLAFPK